MIAKKIVLGLAALAIYVSAFAAIKTTNWSLFSMMKKSIKEQTEQKKSNSAIQVALLLDTSGSMSGLIEQAKSQLWNILNELARTVRDGEETTLEIALYEYGNPSKGRNPNQIHQLSHFTTDMDLISQKLFSLTTSGGEEYCGAMIQASLNDLEWKSDDGLRIIYIAGNEPFTQGPVHYVDACKNAQAKGVIVNTIYCGDHETGIKELWQAGAVVGGGEFLNIDHDQETVYVKTPYDDQINQLNIQLNDTYIPYGTQGMRKKENQMKQDANALNYSSANYADRAVFKSSKKYKATDWDLVDAYEKDQSVLKDAEVVSEDLKDLNREELEVKIKEAAQARADIQQQIKELDQKRRQYKAEQSKTEEETTLQKSMIQTIQKQAAKKGYEVKN